MDWAAWMASWDHQQEGYLANREERFEVIADVVENTVGPAPTVLDLCCGPGSLGQRILRRLPDAKIVAVDADPVLQLLGHRSHGDERTTWIELDLTDPVWEEVVGAHGPFDAVASTTALHWLAAPTLVAVYAAVGRLLRAGGVFVDGDHLAEPATHPELRRLQTALRRTAQDGRPDYQAWWAQLEAAASGDEELATAFARRASAGTGHPDTSAAPGLALHVEALRHAGFAEVSTVWQHGDDRILVGLR